MVQPAGAYAFAGRGRGRSRGRGGGRGSGRGQGRGGYGVPPPEKARKSTAEMVAYPEERGGAYRPMGAALTIQEIEGDRLTHLAQENWSAAVQPNPPAFKPQIVEDIYSNELHGGKKPPSLRRIMLLEVSQYLESYLWPNFDPETSTPAHVLSIAAMVGEKARENVPAWTCFETRPEHFQRFFARLLTVKAERQLSQTERVMYLLFMIHAFQSLENAAVWEQVRQLVGLPLWLALSPGRRKVELHQHPALAKRWRALERREAKQKVAEAAGASFVPLAQRPDTTLLPSLLDEFLEVLSSIVPAGEPAKPSEQLPQQALLHCERFVELLVDLLSQLPTHRFVRALLEDRAILVKCQLSGLHSHPSGRLFSQLTDMLRFYLAFPIDPIEGDPLTDDQVIARHYSRVQQLQRLLFKHHPQLQELALANCGAVASKSRLSAAVRGLQEDVLRTLVTKQLRLVNGDDTWADSREFLEDVMLATFESKISQTDAVNAMPLYPTEGILWDDNQVPNVHYTGEGCLALPKLNLQFLTTTDYLLRNFHLFRLEATYEIREDIADVLPRFQTHLDDDDKVVFNGWARMAVPLQDFSVIEVRKPNVGENKPASVTADAVFTGQGMRGPIRSEWDQIREHDILFLLSITPPDAVTLARWQTTEAQPKPDELYGLTHVRGCEVVEIKDEEGTLMNDSTGRIRRDEAGLPAGLRRTVTVALDTAQYQLDMNAVRDAGAEDVYSTFNLLMRRKPKENNFKAVLESIRDLLNEHMDAMPVWLHQLFLGYGLPDSAHYSHMPNLLTDIDFKDTFLDAQHLRASFPEYDVDVINGTSEPEPVRPFRITFPPPAEPAPLANGHAQPPAPAAAKPSGKRKRAETADPSSAPAADAPPPAGTGQAQAAADDDVSMADAPPQQKAKLVARSYTPPDPGPYPENKPPENTVRFTPVQVEAIKAGVQPGLTMVVGPPGTGKTDTAVQIMHVLYHNCPGQRTLLIAHSNQALNDLFEKLLQRDVPARYLLRLGQGESELAAQGDFSRVGRVNAMLARRLTLLAEVERMAKQMGVAGDVSYTCETAAHFWLLHVLSRWEKFLASAQQLRTDSCVQELFPFSEYFADAPGGLFRGGGFEGDMERARGAFRHLKTMFQELEECRAFELLKGQADRVNYLMTKQAKVVAMTCTHAALRRGEFLRLGFQYDNLLMEESAQILEIETFIPLLLQKAVDGQSRLKRVTLIGDHHQLPPVVKNMAFQKYSHLDQSLFTRFIRLGVPTVQLNAQGRARPSLARLYNWRYTGLGDLPNVSAQPEYLRANPGMAYEYQLLDVGDAEESAPLPYFYQNVEEARRLVTLYQYLRLRGYPANKISILTTYNGQKALLREEIDNRCVNNPAVRELYGRPHKVTTVDKYQGQQNDYVLLSLVRTRAVGHLRDVRRLVVALSRARLGLYIFGRAQLFANCYEMAPAMQQLLAQPLHFALQPDERWQDCERPAGQTGAPLIIQDPAQLADLVNRQTAERLAPAHTAAITAVTASPTTADGSAEAA